MTYEEAIELIDCALGNGCSKPCNYKNRGQCTNDMVVKAKEIAVDALKKQEKYMWHDLRKNPDDVPYKDMRYDKHSEEFSILFDAPKVIGIDKHGQVTEHIEGVNGKYFCARTRNEIVAWKYLEPFEVD